MRLSVNFDIAVTHIMTRRRQTLVAALGVTIGVAIYLFMNSLSDGFTTYSRAEIFKNNAHIKIYKDDAFSLPLSGDTVSGREVIIVNPQITTVSKNLINPEALLATVKAQPYVTAAIAQVGFSGFFSRGNAQLSCSGSGVDIADYDAMYGLRKYMVAGSTRFLAGNLSGIIIGSGIASKLSLGIGDNITVSSSLGVVKVLKIVGIFTMGNSITDKSKCFVNLSTAQQLVKQGPAFVSEIYANTREPDEARKLAARLQRLTAYKVESWQTTKADVLAGDRTRGAMMRAISMSILLVAAFGIYNILSATISQKITDIAILKATGFSSRDVIRIFILEALLMGLIGTLIGLCAGGALIAVMSRVYMGGPVGYFPIYFNLRLFAQSFILGTVITLCSGYFPARRAAKVDPVSIFRR